LISDYNVFRRRGWVLVLLTNLFRRSEFCRSSKSNGDKKDFDNPTSLRSSEASDYPGFLILPHLFFFVLRAEHGHPIAQCGGKPHWARNSSAKRFHY
jgi:hypothetical protein